MGFGENRAKRALKATGNQVRKWKERNKILKKEKKGVEKNGKMKENLMPAFCYDVIAFNVGLSFMFVWKASNCYVDRFSFFIVCF